MSHRVGVIGDLDSVIGFRGLGLTVVACEEAAEADHELRRLADAGYAVIFLTESLAVDLTETIDLYRSAILPAIILIPSARGSSGVGMQQLRDSVRRAVGIDLLGKPNESST